MGYRIIIPNKYRNGIPDYYPYIGSNTTKEKLKVYDRIIGDTIILRNIEPQITINPGDSILKRKIKKYGINRTTFLWYRWAQVKNYISYRKVLLLKDPIGIFLSEHLLKKYNFKVIVTIRHPAAVALSRKSLNWQFDFDWWRNQNDLYNGHFNNIDKTLKDYNLDIISETAFHWLTCYSYIHKIKSLYPEKLHIIRHEDLCRNPTREMEKVFRFIGTEFGDKVERKIISITTGNRLEKSSLNLAKLERRDAKHLIFKWKREVSEYELSKIKEITGEVSGFYYSNPVYWRI
jgi:hypothetical protein